MYTLHTDDEHINKARNRSFYYRFMYDMAVSGRLFTIDSCFTFSIKKRSFPVRFSAVFEFILTRTTIFRPSVVRDTFWNFSYRRRGLHAKYESLIIRCPSTSPVREFF